MNNMPIGILINNAAVALAGLLGGLVGSKLSKNLTNALNQLMGFIALGIAIVLTVKVHTLGAVVLSVIIGTIIGTALRLDDRIGAFFSGVNAKLFKAKTDDEEYISQFTTLLILCCASGTGVFGSIAEGLSGDNTIIICKAILDFTTVLIFASSLGKSCSIIAIPQMIIFLILFFSARVISPIMTDVLKADFSAVGGFIELIIALRILKLSKFKAADTLPALILAFPISYLWNLVF